MTWFTCIEEKVEGPYELEKLKEMLVSGSLPKDCLIWGRGQEEWRQASKWIGSVDSTVQKLEPKKQGQAWHFALDGESKGPMSRAELLHELRHIREKDEILVWTKGMKQWADLFDFHDLVDELGLNRRTHLRANIDGTLTVTLEDGGKLMGHLRTCSEGGMGAGGFHNNLSMGLNVKLDINSDKLGEPFSVKAQVQYVTDSGYVGFKFLSIGMEAKSKIVQHINENKLPESSEEAA